MRSGWARLKSWGVDILGIFPDIFPGIFPGMYSIWGVFDWGFKETTQGCTTGFYDLGGYVLVLFFFGFACEYNYTKMGVRSGLSPIHGHFNTEHDDEPVEFKVITSSNRPNEPLAKSWPILATIGILVISTPLKNISQWEGLSMIIPYIMENKKWSKPPTSYGN